MNDQVNNGCIVIQINQIQEMTVVLSSIKQANMFSRTADRLGFSQFEDVPSQTIF